MTCMFVGVAPKRSEPGYDPGYFTTIITEENIQKVKNNNKQQQKNNNKKKQVKYGGPVGKGYSWLKLLIAKFNLGPKEMERNFILICYPMNKEKRNCGEQFYPIKMVHIGHDSSLTFKFSE